MSYRGLGMVLSRGLALYVQSSPYVPAMSGMPAPYTEWMCVMAVVGVLSWESRQRGFSSCLVCWTCLSGGGVKSCACSRRSDWPTSHTAGTCRSCCGRVCTS